MGGYPAVAMLPDAEIYFTSFYLVCQMEVISALKEIDEFATLCILIQQLDELQNDNR